MYGKNIGSLNVYSRAELDGLESVLFRKSYEIGDYWERLEIKLNETQQVTKMRIIVEGVVGNGNLGNIAIDDISFTSGCKFDPAQELSTLVTQRQTTTTTTIAVCPNNSFKCKSNDKIQCIPDEKVCNFIADCDDSSDEADCGTCDFETSWCGFVDRSNDKFVWNRKQAPSSNSQGPQVDHTFGQSKNGYFISTEINPQGQYVNQAKLLGPKLQKTSESCKVSMWIHMKSPLISTIDFLFTNSLDYENYEFLYSIDGPLGKIFN